tara:strand:- start:483 stop:1535 length:1053 start_codon:yes stop_codon:yes gene_type:complete
MSEFRVNSITNQDGSTGPQVCGVSTFSGGSGVQIPSGPTEFRKSDGSGRGRGIVAGGITPSNQTTIDVLEIATLGDSTDFGDLSYGRAVKDVGCSSATRALFGGGYIVGTGDSNAIDFVIISSGGGANDFGNLNVATLRDGGKVCNSTRGIWAGGQVIPSTSPGTVNIIQFVTMATTGDASNFGDLTKDRRDAYGVQSSTRGVFAGQETKFPSSAAVNILDFITIATTGNAQDFGDMLESGNTTASGSSSTRGIYAGGGENGNSNTISFITIATKGNAENFGDLTQEMGNGSGTSSQVRFIRAGGRTPSLTDVIDFVTIASTGNASDFGDIQTARRQLAAASDAHGGLTQ